PRRRGWARRSSRRRPSRGTPPAPRARSSWCTTPSSRGGGYPRGVERADVVVVGAGLAGCAVAWHLAPRARVLVVEQGEAPGAEATAQNAGMVRRLGEDPFERALAIRTAEWLADPGADWEGTEPSRVTGAVLALARDPFHLHDGVAHLRARGVRIEACDRPAEVAPALAGSPVP